MHENRQRDASVEVSAHAQSKPGAAKADPAAGSQLVSAQGSAKPGSAARKPAGRGSKREARTAERRQAIVDAALEEFSAKGFAAARLEDIAARAGVAKGTIYLHFEDKDALFQELVRTSIVPILGGLAPPSAAAQSARDVFERFAETFLREVYGTRRADIIRLVMTEGPRFPALAEFYYREVVSRGIAGMQRLIAYGVARGEIANPELAKFPQLLVAPAMLAVLWQGLFGKFSPLDARAMLDLHIDLIFGARRRP